MVLHGVPPVFSFGMTEMTRCLAEAEADNYHAHMPALIGTFAFWAIALEDGLRDMHGARYADLRRDDPNAAGMPGLRLARNAVSHGQLICAQASGMTFPMTFPLHFGPWAWKQLGELLRQWKPQQSRWLADEKASYSAHLESKLPSDTMRAAVAWLRTFTPH